MISQLPLHILDMRFGTDMLAFEQVPESHKYALMNGYTGGYPHIRQEFNMSGQTVWVSRGHIMCAGIFVFISRGKWQFFHEMPRFIRKMNLQINKKILCFLQESAWVALSMGKLKETRLDDAISGFLADISHILTGFNQHTGKNHENIFVSQIKKQNLENFGSVNLNLVTVHNIFPHTSFTITFGNGSIVIWTEVVEAEKTQFLPIAKFTEQDLLRLIHEEI